MKRCKTEISRSEVDEESDGAMVRAVDLYPNMKKLDFVVSDTRIKKLEHWSVAHISAMPRLRLLFKMIYQVPYSGLVQPRKCYCLKWLGACRSPRQVKVIL